MSKSAKNVFITYRETVDKIFSSTHAQAFSYRFQLNTRMAFRFKCILLEALQAIDHNETFEKADVDNTLNKCVFKLDADAFAFVHPATNKALLKLST